MSRNAIDHISELIYYPAKYKFLANKTENGIAALTHNMIEKETVSSFEGPNITPKSATQKYFYWYINIHLSSYLKEVKIQVDRANSTFEKCHIINSSLGKVLSPLLRDLGKCIASNRHKFFYSHHSRTRAYHSDNDYIGILLKEFLCRTYINIQNQYEEFVLQDMFSLCDLERKYFDSHTRQSYACGSGTSYFQVKNPKIVPKSLGLFDVSYKDIHRRYKSQPRYEDLVINKRQFGEIELHMYQNGLINAEYSFIPCKEESHKTLMALIYHELIRKGIFKTYFIKQNRDFTPIDYRKYLDERYSVDTSQQFRRITPEQREYAIKKLPWIAEFPHLF